MGPVPVPHNATIHETLPYSILFRDTNMVQMLPEVSELKLQ